MSEKRVPVVHDPAAEVDLSAPTMAAYQRVAYRTRGAVKYLQQKLEDEGMIGTAMLSDTLRREAARLEDDELGAVEFPPPPIEPGSEGLWVCPGCENVNPPAALRCLVDDCGQEQPELEEEESEPEADAEAPPPPTAPSGNGAISGAV